MPSAAGRPDALQACVGFASKPCSASTTSPTVRTDLKASGLLDTTLVVWHGEFGRMPISQRGLGRDHNPGAMSMWMAGAKIPGGIIMGIIVKPPTKFDVNLAARSITKEVQKSVAGAKLTPKVIVDGGFTTMGFIFRPVEFEQ